MTYESLLAETIHLRGHQNDQIDAYLARPLGAGPYPGVVIIHHMPGWDDAHKEIARRFAHHGYVAISPNLQFREGKATPEENSASVRAAGGMPDDRTMGDVQASIDYLRALPYVGGTFQAASSTVGGTNLAASSTLNGKVGVVGYCSGGRQAYLAACTLRGIDAVIVCYGGGVVAKPAELTPRQPVAPLDFTQDLQCPLLGFFGIEDTRPSPDDAAKTEAALKRSGKTYEFHTYENAGHAFFAVDRPQYRVHAAVDGWKKVFAWFGRYLH